VSDLLAAARAEAQRLQHDYIGTEHLFLALLNAGDPSLTTILGAFSTTPSAVRERLEKRSPQGKGAPENPEELPLRSGARRALDQARTLAGGEETAPRHLVAALLADGKGVVASSLGDLGIPVAKVREALGIAKPEGGERGEKRERPDKPERPAKPERREHPDRRERQEARDKERTRAARAPTAAPAAPAAPPERRERSQAGAPEREAPSGPRTPPRIAPVHEPLLSWRNLPILFIPLSLYFAWGGDFPPALVFGTSCLAVLPLAGYMGEATEHLSARTGPALGGLLNATFGNAAELIIAIVALQAGLVDLVKASITGSILGNLLLILGLSLVAGGLNKPIVRFNRTAVGMSAGMMALAVTGLMFPALFHGTHQGPNLELAELYLSEAVSVVLVITYGLSLLFSLKTHSRLIGGEPHPTTGHLWSVPFAIGVLALATVGVAVESEILVHRVEDLTRGFPWITQSFLGLIIIPIIGNAAEHATAIVVARKGKMDLALQIALGSSTQVALLIAPILVFVGAFLGSGPSGHYMNLVFTPLEVAAVGLSTILAAIVTLDGESHWFEGVQLLALYAMVAIAVFFI